MSDRTYLKHDSKKAILAATSVLEGFAIKKEGTALSLLQDFLLAPFSRKSREEKEKKRAVIKETVLHALGILKDHQRALEKMQSGSNEERSIATSAKKALAKVIEAAHGDADLSKWISHFEGMPSLQELKSHHFGLFSENSKDAGNRIKQTFNEHILSPLHDDLILAKEIDILRMKAHTLMLAETSFNNRQELISSIQKGSTTFILDPQTQISKLQMTVTLYPNIEIQISGSFQRHCAKRPSLPLTDTFKLTYKKQNGCFPTPSQYTGWSLSYPLISTATTLYQQHQKVLPTISPYNPDNSLVELSKLLKAKQTICNSIKEKLLPLHRTLALALIQSDIEHDSTAHFVNLYFDELSLSEAPLDTLETVYQAINARFIIQPFLALQQEWSEKQTAEEMQKASPSERLQLASSLLNGYFESNLQSSTDEDMTRLIHLLAKNLWPAAHDIILQHLSKPFNFSAPMLDTFAQKIQALAYRQLAFFIDEIQNNKDLAAIEKNILNEFESAISLLNAPSIEAVNDPFCHLVKELERQHSSK